MIRSSCIRRVVMVRKLNTLRQNISIESSVMSAALEGKKGVNNMVSFNIIRKNE